MASPIQIILNQKNFEESRERQGGGSKRDFFAFRDAEFVHHKDSILNQMASIGETLRAQDHGNIGIVKVVLRREAWAKSHRPVKSLFAPERIPLIGGADLGEMLFEATSSQLQTVSSAMSRAEVITTLKLNKTTDREAPNPSSFKSELGAISRVEIYSPADRRDFSTDEAIAWLSNPLTGSSYLVELFEEPVAISDLDTLSESRRLLHQSFRDGLKAMSGGLSVQRLHASEAEQPQLTVRLEQSDEPPRLLLTDKRTVDRRRGRELVPFEAEPSRHQKLLAFLDHHPLVRRIELPPIITRTATRLVDNAQGFRQAPETIDLPERDAARTYPNLGIVDGGISPILNDWVRARWDILADEDKDLDHGTFIGGLAVAGNALNGETVCSEPDGVELVDVAVFPDESSPTIFESYYPSGLPDFFDEVDQAISEWLSSRIVGMDPLL